MKKKYVIQLNENKQKQIKEDLKKYFKEDLNLTNQEIEEELELAMSSRLVDLEDSIDINQYIDYN